VVNNGYRLMEGSQEKRMTTTPISALSHNRQPTTRSRRITRSIRGPALVAAAFEALEDDAGEAVDVVEDDDGAPVTVAEEEAARVVCVKLLVRDVKGADLLVDDEEEEEEDDDRPLDVLFLVLDDTVDVRVMLPVGWGGIVPGAPPLEMLAIRAHSEDEGIGCADGVKGSPWWNVDVPYTPMGCAESPWHSSKTPAL